MNNLIDSKTKNFIASDTYAIIKQVYTSGIKEIMTKLEILDQEFHLNYDYNPIHTMDYRLKEAKSIIAKLDKKDLPYDLQSIQEHIFDIAGVRVICNYVDDIYRIVRLLTAQDDIEIHTLKDYIKEPKESGYRSLHLVVLIPIFLSKGKTIIPVEIQIRTIAMDFWASLEHQIKYKTTTHIPSTIHKELLECANEITQLDKKMQQIHNQVKIKSNH